MDYDPLIYGKNSLERIVGLEVKDSVAEVFVQEPDHSIRSFEVPNKFWLLASRNLGSRWRKLKGDLHYKWGRLADTRAEFLECRSKLWKHDGFSIYDPKEALMVKDGYTFYKGLRHDEVSVLAFDIEATTLFHTSDARVLLIATTFRERGNITRRLFAFNDFPTQGALLQAFAAYVRECNPSVIVGHNIFSYDLPYLQFIAEREGTELALGRNGSALWFDDRDSKFRRDASQFYHYKKAHIYGRELIDTLFSSIRYDVGRKYESYALKNIIKQEGLIVEGRQFYDASQIRFNYEKPEEWAKIKQYAVHDGDDALAIYDLTTPPLFYLTQTVPKSFQAMIESASGSQINAVMMRSYLQQAHSLPKATDAIEYEGGISFGNPGIYRNVFKVDVGSLYPNIMLEHQIYEPAKDPQGYFIRLVQTFTARRLKHKKLAKTDKYYDDLQNAEKIFINSCYGFLGAPGLLFNAPRKAEQITSLGRQILQQGIDWAESRCFQIVNADTDSVSFCDKAGAALSAATRQELLAELNTLFPERIKYEDDGYYPTVVIVRAKNYVLHNGSTIKLKGSGLKATTKEPALQQFIREICETIVERRSNFKEIYERNVLEIKELKDIRRWCTRKTITEKVLDPKRTNEQKVKDAIEDSEYTEGDRAYFFFKSDNTLALAETFDGDYNRDKLLEKLFRTAEMFDTILDTDSLFLNYKLKRNRAALDSLGRSSEKTN